MFDQELNMHTIDSVDKFIEIEFNRADKSGLVVLRSGGKKNQASR
jgi:hypothetical protein